MRRYDRSGGETALSLLSYPVATALSLVMALSAKAQVSDLYAYHTRLDYDDRSDTGKYADLVVRVGTTGTFTAISRSKPGSRLRSTPGTGRGSSITTRTNGPDTAWRSITWVRLACMHM